jgi:hypothetical protein
MRHELCTVQNDECRARIRGLQHKDFLLFRQLRSIVTLCVRTCLQHKRQMWRTLDAGHLFLMRTTWCWKDMCVPALGLCLASYRLCSGQIAMNKERIIWKNERLLPESRFAGFAYKYQVQTRNSLRGWLMRLAHDAPHHREMHILYGSHIPRVVHEQGLFTTSLRHFQDERHRTLLQLPE